MSRPTNAEYRRAVETAKAAIEEVKNRPRVRADRPTAQAALATIRAKAAKGEAPSTEELGALGAAVEDRAAAKVKRKRGRPKGSGRVKLERRAVHAAFTALEGSSLAYFAKGNALCNAVAEAMRACGFRHLATRPAVEFEAKRRRKKERAAGRFMVELNARLSPIRAATAPARRARARANAIVHAVQEPTLRIREILESRFPPEA